MSLRIKNQHGVIVTNVDGDQVIRGGQHAMGVPSEDARRAVRGLRDALASAALGGATAAQARVHVAEIDAAVHAPEPDKRRAARPLKRLVELLANAASLATAGAALTGPPQTHACRRGAPRAALLGRLAPRGHRGRTRSGGPRTT